MRDRFPKNNDIIRITQPDYASVLNSVIALNERWRDLCERFLPVSSSDPIWRYSRQWQETDPAQGWKIHVSATILTAGQVLETVAPFLKSHDALFKAPVSLQELKKINSGIIYHYTQVGKFITVYPRTEQEAVFFAEKLHQLTYQMPAPAVPYDGKLKSESCVHYRYGSFKTVEIKNSAGETALAMRDPAGNLIPDLRDSKFPEWVKNPFPTERPIELGDSPLKRHYKIFRALSQRGKGGVYQALDMSRSTPRFCLIKEGRKNGETDWDGRDGKWRIRHERSVLRLLGKAGINVPKVYSFFETADNYYLVTEYIEGENLGNFLLKRKRRLSIPAAIKYSIRISALMAQVHSAGWLWRDCKPENFIVTKSGNLRPVDFEGACLIKEPDFIAWNTPLFAPPEWKEKPFRLSEIADDLFTLGANIFFLFEGKLPGVTVISPPKILRRNVPIEVHQIIEGLLNLDSAQRPSAQTVTQKLQAVLDSTENKFEKSVVKSY